MRPEEVFLSVVAMVGFALLAFPLVRALSERIRPRVDVGIKDELVGLREDVLTELREMRREVAELGERVDFTERLLAKQRDPERLARGGAGGGGGRANWPRRGAGGAFFAARRWGWARRGRGVGGRHGL